MEEIILETKELCKQYHKQTVLKNINMRIPKGCVYGLLGANGAGKSTLMKILCGMTRADAGEVFFDGKIWSRKCIERIGALIELPPVYENLSAVDNLKVRTWTLGISDARILEVLDIVDLKNTGKKSGNLTQYGIICPVDSYDSKMVSEEDGSRMGKIKKLVGSEFLKLKGTWIFWIHLGVPVAGAGLFLLYGVAAKREWQSVLEFYAETLAIVYPSVSAIICMQSVMQELKAGNFQNLLCVSTLRWSAVLRKILTLWILGLAASLLAFLLFGMGIWGTKAAWNLSVKEYLICGLILWITQAGIYLLHFFLAMRFGSGACLAAGVTQSLIAALLFTGLGDGLWMWFPCGWSGHLLLYYVKWKTESEVFKMAGEMLKEQIRTGVLSMVGMTITGLILWCIWIQHHDRKSISQ